MMRHLLICASVLLLVTVLFSSWSHPTSSSAAPLSAAEGEGMAVALGSVITVTTTVDEMEINDACSLREAIQAAETDSNVDSCAAGNGRDIIDLPAGHYDVTRGQLALDGAVTIQGSAKGASILDGGGHYRVFYIRPNATVTLLRLEIAHGTANAEYCLTCVAEMGSGGGVANYGTTWIVDSTLHSNKAGTSWSNPYDESGAYGGGIFNAGILTVTNSTISVNAAGDGSPDGNGHAGEIFCSYGGEGGGIANFGMLTLDNATLANNGPGMAGPRDSCPPDADGSVGGLYNAETASATVRNSIIAQNQGSDCGGFLASLGYNLVQATDGCALSGSFVHWAANLGPLQDNGGPTQTRALAPNSPAVDAGSCTDSAGLAVLADQRGRPRPQGEGCDIGAFESPYTSTFVIYDMTLPLVALHPSLCSSTVPACNLTNSPLHEQDPAWSPNGQRLAFAAFTIGDAENSPSGGIYVANMDGSNLVKLVNQGKEPAWSPDGNKLAFTCCVAATYNNVFLMDADGSHVTQLTNSDNRYWERPKWSPDGRKILVSVSGGSINGTDLFVMNVDGSHQFKLAGTASHGIGNAWSPDSSRIVFQTLSFGMPTGMTLINADGSNRVEFNPFPEGENYHTGGWSWSPVDNILAFYGVPGSGSELPALYVINADGSQLTQVTSNVSSMLGPFWSQDGSKLFYQKQLSTANDQVDPTFEIFSINADGSHETQLTTDTPPMPYWGQPVLAPDGSKIAFLALHWGKYDIFVLGLEK